MTVYWAEGEVRPERWKDAEDRGYEDRHNSVNKAANMLARAVVNWQRTHEKKPYDAEYLRSIEGELELLIKDYEEAVLACGGNTVERSKPLRRKTPLKSSGRLDRKPTKRKTVKGLKAKPRVRAWGEARAKVEAEGRCRSCKRGGPLDCAHTIARAVQDVRGVGNSFLWVDPESVIPLCRACHMAQHGKRLDISGLLTSRELLNAGRACKRAKLNLRRQLTGSREVA